MENSSPQPPPPSPPPTGCFIGCLIAFVAGIALLFASPSIYFYFEEQRHQAYITKEATELFNEIKAGGNWGMIFDPLMIEMLASDEQCITNLTRLYFSAADLSDPRYKAVAKLKNLRTLEFYDCYHDDKLLAAMQGMPSVEEMEFDSMRESAERERLLKTFPNLKTVMHE
jgi:hypothetical protein